MSLINVLKSESIKRKGSSLNWLIIGGSLFIPLVMTIARLTKHEQTVMQNSTEGIWMKLFHQNWQYMSLLLLPMGIALACSLLNQLEYRNNTWKQLWAMPINSSTIFIAKYISLGYCLLQFFVLFTLGIYLTGLIPVIVYSDVIYPKEEFPLYGYLSKSLEYLIDCLPIVAIQFLLSFHIRNYIIPIAIAFILLIGSLIAVNWEYGYVLPYSYSSLSFLKADNKINPEVNLQKWALAYFILISALNYILLLVKSHLSIPLIKKGHGKKEVIMLLLVILFSITSVLALNYFNDSEKKPVAKTGDSVTAKIAAVENNWGSFKILNNKDWTIEERMKFYQVPGMSIAVINNYSIEWAKAYGYSDKLKRSNADTNTLFIPGSLSKSINALGIMKLVQDKKMDLFTDINQQLISWKFPYDKVANGKMINLAHLLSHTAGTNVHGFMGYTPKDSIPSLIQIIKGVHPANSERIRSLTEPGKEMRYSGGGVLISQLLLTDITGMPYNQYMKEQIFGPLNMNNTSFSQYSLQDSVLNRAVGYGSLGNELEGKYPILPEQSAAGAWTTPIDMCKFVIEIQQSLRGKSNKIINRTTTKMMLTPYMNEEAALGFFIKKSGGYSYFGHDAGNRGFSGMFYGSMEGGYGVAIFINSENSDILREVLNSVMDSYHWPGFDAKKNVNISNPDKLPLQEYQGTYCYKDDKENTTLVEVIRKNNDLFYCIGNKEMKIYFLNDTNFINNEGISEKAFKLDENGKVKGILVKKNSNEFFLSKVKLD